MGLQDYIHEKPVLQTERLILRTLKPTDVTDLKEWSGDNSFKSVLGKTPREKLVLNVRGISVAESW